MVQHIRFIEIDQMVIPVIQLIEYWDVKTERIRLANVLYNFQYFVERRSVS